jgi:GTP-binding protein
MLKPNLNNVTLKISAGVPKQFPREGLPQIAISGRSNVGKSSLINTLLGRKSLARVSSAPGKTITVNFYDIDKKMFLVDLPGYGYAKRSFEDKKKWSALTDGYFTSNPNIDLLKGVVQLVDSRIGLTNDDVDMINWLIESEIPFIVVATKVDKLNATNRKNNLAQLREDLHFGEEDVLVPFSSQTKEGKEELWREIFRLCD